LDNTFQSIAGSKKDQITLNPVVDPSGTVEWALYIPPTTKDAFDGGDAPDFNPLENPIEAPYDITYWPTLTEAVQFLQDTVKRGDVKFNDGRSIV
jgi:hypothetical protein